MHVVSHGVDLVEVARIAEMLAQHPGRFRERVFTPAELEYAAAGRREAEHLAARFAAKEAAFKALGTGLSQGLSWTDVEVLRSPSGEPTLALHGRAAQIAAQKGIARMILSLSHTDTMAMASVIAVGDPAHGRV